MEVQLLKHLLKCEVEARMILLPMLSIWKFLWKKWELRVAVLISLVSQIILALFGNRRKFKPNTWKRPLVWAAYMIADWVPTFALGVITSTLGDYYDDNSGENEDMNPQLIAFWAPFFLVHLGGQDTITAYSLEDNELWLRYLVSLLVQTGVTIYIILLSWNNTSWLSYLSIPMLTVGFIKFGERIWSLYSASMDHLRDSILSWKSDTSSDDDAYDRASEFMEVFISLFVDLVLTPSEMIDPSRINRHFLSAWAWEQAQYGLKWMYEILYTKAFAIYNFRGFILRLITSLAIMVVLILYIISNNKINKEYSVLDHVITYLLLVEALILEINALMLLLCSRWFRWRSKDFNIFHHCRMCHMIWLGMQHESEMKLSFGQTNILTSVCNGKENLSGNFLLAKKLQDVANVGQCEISYDLRQMIFNYSRKLEEEMRSTFPSMSRPGYRHHVSNHLKVPIASNLEFHRAIVTWHIVTDICYYHDEDLSSESRNESNNLPDYMNESKNLSDYMFYLLVKCRHMLPVGSGLVTLTDTYEEVKKHSLKKDIREACRDLLQFNPNTPIYQITMQKSRSVLSYACITARELLKGNQRDREQMWRLLAELWIEILMYASGHCRVDNHAQQLRKGEEFLSLVWLLQPRLILLEQYPGILDDGKKEVVACRLSGQIVASWFLEGARSLEEVTTVQRGIPRVFPREHHLMPTEKGLCQKCCITFGGKIAQEALLGRGHWISDHIRNYRNWDEDDAFLAERVPASFEDHTIKLMEQHEDKVVQIAELLVLKEVIHKEELVKILGEPSFWSDQPINNEIGTSYSADEHE